MAIAAGEHLPAAAAAIAATWLAIWVAARELSTAVGGGYVAIGLFVLVSFWLAGAGLAASLWLCGIAVICVGIGEIDARKGIIPDTLVAGLVVLAVITPFAPALASQASGAAICGGLFWTVRWSYFRLRDHEGLGFGDVKLAAAMGALLGAEAALLAVAGAAAATAFWLLLQRMAADPTDNGGRAAPLGVGLATATAATAALRLGGIS